MGTWKFRELSRGDIKQDPQEAEFFTEEGKPDALVREVIQNSLDASADRGIRLRFAFERLKHEAREQVHSRFFDGIVPHLRSQEFIDENPLGQELDFLVLEDFGTTGLLGDPRVYSDREADSDNSFFWFWRNVGRSGKSESDLGRWGVGKTVFPTSSRMFSYFGLTRRTSDDRALLMGLSVMKTHAVGETEYKPYGYYGRFDEDGFPLPIEDPETIGLFRSIFRLSRDGEPGLSVVIPYPKSEITPQAVQAAVIREFFYPVLEGTLDVIIETGDEEIEIGRNSIVERALEVPWDKFDEEEERIYDLLDFTEAAIRSKDNPDAELRCAGTDGAPRWTDELFEGVDLESLRETWTKDQPVTVRVPLRIKARRGEDLNSEFTVVVQRDEGLPKGESHYIRGGLVVPDAGKAVPGQSTGNGGHRQWAPRFIAGRR